MTERIGRIAGTAIPEGDPVMAKVDLFYERVG